MSAGDQEPVETPDEGVSDGTDTGTEVGSEVTEPTGTTDTKEDGVTEA